ncbi:AidA/PixA family protein [Xenorhabdus bovienii]|uniref:AidA/PixA family protein n=1 Tax=Xenorhabdus bovienii TaxID=40576 RepID=UPI0023B28A4A|nr:AidA/PixA family protein [Xenorhabdus bovienii]MDE9457728.1 inclusion body family protein [Xenorhabdus bovienii]MDE9467158.1 inclusion body family protein [Xenorhabdus bovienii]MDE9515313.1 inclusion body family protein [Xenorhabdus bovienii]
MADIIDILVVVDAQSIMKFITDSKIKNDMNVDKPINLGATTNYINMLTPQNIHYISGQGTSVLWVKANLNDTIRWRGVTLSKDSEYSAALMKFYPLKITAPAEVSKYFNAPEVKPVHSYVPVLKSDKPIIYPNPVELDLQPTDNYYWEVSVKRMPDHGKSVNNHYAFTIGIYKNGYLQAYVYWDPTIVLDSTK